MLDNNEKFVETPNKFFITILIMAAAFMEVMDITITNVILPHMQGALSATQDEISWVLTSYIASAAITMPLTGWLSRRFGRKPIFLISILGFTISSALCGIATNLTEIVLFRTLQGISGAALVPLSQAILFDINPKHMHGKAMAIWGIAITMAPILGPLVGGWFTDNYNWRWVFYINVPVGVFVMLGLWFVMPNTKKILGDFDFFGFVMMALSIGALQIMLDRGERQDWFNSNEIIIETIVMCISFYLFLIHTVTHSRPFLSPNLFKDRNFLIASILIFLIGGILFATLAILPTMLQNNLGYPVFTTGLVIAPRGIGAMTAMIIIGRIIGKVNVRYIIISGLCILSIALWSMTQFNLYMGSITVITSGIMQGLGIGCCFVPLGVVAFSTLSPDLRNEGTSFFNLMRNIGGSLGISIIVSLLTRNTQIMHSSLSEHISAYNTDINITKIQLAALNAEITKQASMVAYINDFKLMMILTIMFIPLVFLIKSAKKKSGSQLEMVIE